MSAPDRGGEASRDDARHDRALGAFLGLAVGDALGTTLEFRSRASYPELTDMIGGGPFGLKAGEWTDDTSMALCLADSLLAQAGRLDARNLANRFVNWWHYGQNSVTGECFDIGTATANALSRYLQTGDPRGSDSPTTAGNGGIMRLAPVVLAAQGAVEASVALARAQSEVTHAAPECLDAAEILARVLSAAIAGEGKAALLAGSGLQGGSERLRRIAAGSWREKERAGIASGGYVADTLEAALWAVGRSETFEQALLLAVNLGEDADTVGAVTGQVAGAVWGYRSIPERWRQKLAWHDHLVVCGERLWRLCLGEA